jgi:hypothetical protein
MPYREAPQCGSNAGAWLLFFPLLVGALAAGAWVGTAWDERNHTEQRLQKLKEEEAAVSARLTARRRQAATAADRVSVRENLAAAKERELAERAAKIDRAEAQFRDWAKALAEEASRLKQDKDELAALAAKAERDRREGAAARQEAWAAQQEAARLRAEAQKKLDAAAACLRAVVNHPATRLQLGRLRGTDAAGRQAAAGWFAALPAGEYPGELAEALLEALAGDVKLPGRDRGRVVIGPWAQPEPPSDPAAYLKALGRVAPRLDVRPFVYEPFRAYGTPASAYLGAVRGLREEKGAAAVLVPLLLRHLRYCLRALEDGAPAGEAARELLATLAALAPEDGRVTRLREYVHYHPRRQVRELFD